jgi:hypothetical protein
LIPKQKNRFFTRAWSAASNPVVLTLEILRRKAAALGASLLRLFTDETACTRGTTLLKDWLSPEQRSQFERTRSFLVIGCDTGKHYCIRHGTATNVFEIDETGYPVIGWCFLPSGNLVAGDVMLAQKIALENEEVSTLRVARRFPVNIARKWQNLL